MKSSPNTNKKRNPVAQKKSDALDLDVSGSNTVSVKVSPSDDTVVLDRLVKGVLQPSKKTFKLDPRTPSKKRQNPPPAQSRADDVRVLTAGGSNTDFESAVVSASVSVSSTDNKPRTPGGARREKLTRKGTVEDIDPKADRRR